MDLTLNIAIMKFRIFLFFAFIFCIISCKNANEPAIKEPFDGKNVTLRIAPPSFGNSASSVAARKISGTYTSSNEEITFRWAPNDTIQISSLDDNMQIISSKQFTVSVIDEKTGIATFTGDLPQGSTQGMYKIAAGPGALIKNQSFKSYGISNGTMRFINESFHIDESTELIPLYPAWSALIFNPVYTYTFLPKYNEFTEEGLNPYYTETTIALKQLVVEVCTEDSTYSITYKDKSSIKFTSKEGDVSTKPLILVIAPTEKCKSIKATYTHDLSKCEGSTEDDQYEKDLSHNLQEQVIKTLVFKEGEEPALKEQIAYVLDPSTVTDVTWTGTPTE